MVTRRTLGWILGACSACVVLLIAITWSPRVPESSTPSVPQTTPPVPQPAIDAVVPDAAPQRVALDAPESPITTRDEGAHAAPFANPGTDGSEERERSPLAQRVDRVTATFATGEPDTRGLLGVVRDLAGQARVVDGSVTKSETGDVVNGRIAIDGSVAQCRFELEGDRLTIDMYESGIPNVPGAQSRNVSWTVSRAEGSIVCTVQHQLDTTTSAPNTEHIVGWSMNSSGTGTRASVLTMTGSEGVWKIGPSESVSAIDQPWLSESGCGAAWWSLVAPFAE
ncbi:MAG: hypothetical protein ACKVWV_16820 [Planctomycetota bacterium]